jgi:hypothetical protein
MKKRLFAMLIFAAMIAIPPESARAETAKAGAAAKPLAVFFTGENFTGLSWIVAEEGDYDLRKNLDLPNDSVMSVAVRPGVEVTLFEHIGFEGAAQLLDNDAGVLPDFWKRQASSFTVRQRRAGDAKAVESWLETYAHVLPFKAYNKSELDVEAVLNAWKNAGVDTSKMEFMMNGGAGNWYGETTDDERVAMAADLLKIFGASGFDISGWTSDALARQMNNFYDWLPNRSILEAACYVTGIETERFQTGVNAETSGGAKR